MFTQVTSLGALTGLAVSGTTTSQNIVVSNTSSATNFLGTVATVRSVADTNPNLTEGREVLIPTARQLRDPRSTY